LLAALAGQGPEGLARDGEIRALVATPQEVDVALAAAPSAKVHVGDVADDEVVARLFDGAEGASVVHAAGVIHPRTTADFDHVNARGTEVVVGAAARVGVRRFVHVSSNSPFGVNVDPGDVFRNDEPYRPYMGYGRSKMAGELAVKRAGEAGLATVIVRPPWFYGPHQPPRQTTFFQLIRKGRFPLMGKGDQRRSMTYVDNLALGVVLADLHPAAVGRAYWIADARPYPVQEIVDTVREVLAEAGLEVAPRQVRVPKLLGTVAERIDGFLQARGRYLQQVHVLGEMDKTIACDISAAREELGYDPPVELREGMRRSVAWCLEQGLAL
jgi:nucleoside-diphosphate-sugar epimerase